MVKTMPGFDVLRKKMVDNQVRTINVTDWRVLEAMGNVPRELFVPPERRDLAYADLSHALGAGRALAAPAALAKLLHLAEIHPDETALAVGAGTGYATAVLASLCRHATGLEPDAALGNRARANVAQLGLSNATLVSGPLDGSGLTGAYDVIVVEGGVQAVPASLFNRLAEGGRLVAVVSGTGAPLVTVYVRTGEEIGERAEFTLALPPLDAAPAPTVFRF